MILKFVFWTEVVNSMPGLHAEWDLEMLEMCYTDLYIN